MSIIKPGSGRGEVVKFNTTELFSLFAPAIHPRVNQWLDEPMMDLSGRTICGYRSQFNSGNGAASAVTKCVSQLGGLIPNHIREAGGLKGVSRLFVMHNKGKGVLVISPDGRMTQYKNFDVLPAGEYLNHYGWTSCDPVMCVDQNGRQHWVIAYRRVGLATELFGTKNLIGRTLVAGDGPTIYCETSKETKARYARDKVGQ